MIMRLRQRGRLAAAAAVLVIGALAGGPAGAETPSQPQTFTPPPPPPPGIQRTAGDPVDTLKAIYAALDKDRPEVFSKRLAALRTAAERRAEQLNEAVAGLDFDYVVSGQDFDPKLPGTVRYQVLGADDRRAAVEVTFVNFRPVTLRYDLVRENGRWMIDDVWSLSGERWTLSDLLRLGAQ